ncbi:unnamed protein product [Symbiodinium sp. KB8]|nr:unnamed protein product [Symbiodinium sp. KB8]
MCYDCKCQDYVSDALLAALQEGHETQVKLSYFGHWAWCQNVGNCEELRLETRMLPESRIFEEPLALIFREYQQDWAETDDGLNEVNYQRLLERLRSFLQSPSGDGRELMRADLILCTRPFLFCSLLRSLWPESYPQLPMLHYYSGPLLFDTTPSQMHVVLQAFRQTVLSSTLDLVASRQFTPVVYLADAQEYHRLLCRAPGCWRWLLVHAGVAVPHVRPHAVGLRGRYRPPIAEAKHLALRALVLRSTWVGTLMAQAFETVLLEMIRESSLEESLRLEWLSSGKFLSYEEIASFHAAVFFPEQPDKLTFWEQYEMAMPLWLPTADLWSKIHAIGEYRYSVFAARWNAVLAEGDAAANGCGLPQSLFFNSTDPVDLHSDSPLAPAFWFQLTDYALFPHLQLFASAAELATGLLGADLTALHESMAKFNLESWRRSSSFYRSAICILMEGSEMALTPQFLPQPAEDWAKGAIGDPHECAHVTDFWTNHHECVGAGYRLSDPCLLFYYAGKGVVDWPTDRLCLRISGFPELCSTDFRVPVAMFTIFTHPEKEDIGRHERDNTDL